MLVQKMWRARIFRVAVMGGIAALVQSFIFWILAVWLQVMSPSNTVFIATELGMLVNFSLNNHFSFSDQNHAHLAVRLARYHLTALGSFFSQWLLVFLTERFTTDPWLLLSAYLSGGLLRFIFHYYG